MNTQAQAQAANVVPFAPAPVKTTTLGLQNSTWLEGGKIVGAAAVGAGAVMAYNWFTSPTEEETSLASSEIEKAKASLAGLVAGQAAFGGRIDGHDKQLADLAGRLAALEGVAANHASSINALNGHVQSLHTRVLTLESAPAPAPAPTPVAAPAAEAAPAAAVLPTLSVKNK